jgi:hypothetical protein
MVMFLLVIEVYADSVQEPEPMLISSPSTDAAIAAVKAVVISPAHGT